MQSIIKLALSYTRMIVKTAIAGAALLSSLSGNADDNTKPSQQWASVPKPGLPRFLTKPAKVETELPPKNAANACIATAKDLLDQGYDREAIQLFERGRQLDPKRTEVCRYLGILYDRQNDPIRAKNEYDQALKFKPKDADLLNDIGYFHYHRGEWSDAEKRFREALAQNPKLERAKINLGMALAQQGRFQDAYNTFADAVGPAAAHSNVGVFLAKQGRQAEAVAAFQKALEMEPGPSQAKICLACLTRPATSPTQLELNPNGPSAANRSNR